MDQDPRLFNFISAALALLKLMQDTPGNESKKPNVQTFSTHLTDAKNLLIQGELISPMREDIRELIVQIKRGILEFLRFFEVHKSEEYQAFRAAKEQVDAFLTDPRATAFVLHALECIELLQHLPDAHAIQTQLSDFRDSLVNQQTMLKYHPEQAYEERFASVVEGVTNGFAQFAGLLPDFAASNAYGAFCETALHAGFFLVGLPAVPKSELEV